MNRRADLYSLIYGKDNTVHVNAEGKEANNINPFYQLQLLVNRGNCDIYAAMDAQYLDKQLIEGAEGQYNYASLVEMPAIVQFAIERQYQNASGTMYKTNYQLRLDEEIFMDRYMTTDDMLAKRRRVWTLQEELITLEQQKSAQTDADLGMDMPTILETAKAYLESLSDFAAEDELIREDSNSNMVLQELSRRANQLRVQNSETDARIAVLRSDIADLLPRSGSVSYRLHASFVHSGDSQRGHWVIYIYDHKAKVWRKYNDDHVTTVTDTSEILAHEQARHGSGTSAIVVYVRSEGLDDYVETTHRVPQAGEEQQAVRPLTNQERQQQLTYAGTSEWHSSYHEGRTPTYGW